MNYDQAIIEFNKELETDPMSAEAYLGLVEAYIRSGDFESALYYAKKGYEATGDERLKEKIDMLESGNIYAENGWVMKESFYKGEGELSYYIVYTYKLNGDTESESAYTPNDVFIDKVDYEYDEKGRLTMGVGAYNAEFNGEGSPIYRTEYKYDDNDRIISSKDYDGEGNLFTWRECEYKGNDDVVETMHYSDGSYSVRENGVEKKYDENGNLTRFTESEYDESGKVILEKYYSADGMLTEYQEYEYDSDGNLLKLVLYNSNGKVLYSQVYE
jgi:hypothetical protein